MSVFIYNCVYNICNHTIQDNNIMRIYIYIYIYMQMYINTDYYSCSYIHMFIYYMKLSRIQLIKLVKL